MQMYVSSREILFLYVLQATNVYDKKIKAINFKRSGESNEIFVSMLDEFVVGHKKVKYHD